jgi:hypothetical protein
MIFMLSVVVRHHGPDLFVNAGLGASTVTPGITPPDVSRTTPAIPLAACADRRAGKRCARQCDKDCAESLTIFYSLQCKSASEYRVIAFNRDTDDTRAGDLRLRRRNANESSFEVQGKHTLSSRVFHSIQNPARKRLTLTEGITLCA